MDFIYNREYKHLLYKMVLDILLRQTGSEIRGYIKQIIQNFIQINPMKDDIMANVPQPCDPDDDLHQNPWSSFR